MRRAILEGVKRLLRHNGLSIVLLVIFLACWVGQAVAGRADFNSDLTEHGRSPVRFAPYLLTSHFWQATAENWESEFLQMGMFVVLTKHLFQKGSSESKDPDGTNSVDEDPNDHRDAPNAPWPVRHGGWVLAVYQRSLSITFFALFAISVGLHLWAGNLSYQVEQTLGGQPTPTLGDYFLGGRFWFESMQNWQSEFLSILAMVVLSVYLRERCSPESKPVAMAHGENA